MRSRAGRCVAATVTASSPVTAAAQQITQDAPAHVASFCCSTRIGSVNQKVEPFPRCDSTLMRPPCISTMRLTIVRHGHHEGAVRGCRPRLLPPHSLLHSRYGGA
jgi:hypothetical protein